MGVVGGLRPGPRGVTSNGVPTPCRPLPTPFQRYQRSAKSLISLCSHTAYQRYQRVCKLLISLTSNGFAHTPIYYVYKGAPSRARPFQNKRRGHHMGKHCPHRDEPGFVSGFEEFHNGWFIVIDRRKIGDYTPPSVRWRVKHMESGKFRDYPSRETASIEAKALAGSSNPDEHWWKEQSS